MAKQYSYSDVKKLSDSLVDGSAPKDVILIDVREPSEFSQGFIPGAVNMPFKTHPEALCKSSEEFEQLMGFPKPEESNHLVFYCQSGMRSQMASKAGEKCGYKNQGVYPGSWNEWSEKQPKN